MHCSGVLIFISENETEQLTQGSSNSIQQEKLVTKLSLRYFAMSQEMLLSILTNLQSISEQISAQCCISYKNHSFNLQCKTSDWFLYEMQHYDWIGFKWI